MDSPTTRLGRNIRRNAEKRGEFWLGEELAPPTPHGTARLAATWQSYNHGVAETVVDLGRIVGTVAARARAITPEFDPAGFLEGLSAQLQGLIPHDRVTILYLNEGGRTVSVFGEHAHGDALRRDGPYTLSPARAIRYPIAERYPEPCRNRR